MACNETAGRCDFCGRPGEWSGSCCKLAALGNEEGGEHCAGKGCLGLHCCVQDWGEEPLAADADPATEGVMMEDPNYQEPEAAPQEGGASSSASPAKKAGNKGSSSSKGSPGVDGDEGARGDKQPAMLPTVYFLNLDEEKDMRRRVEKDLSKYTDKLVRVPAVDKAQVLKCLDDGSCAKDDKAQVLGTDYLNTDPELNPNLSPALNLTLI